jgi:hypothetical protein
MKLINLSSTFIASLILFACNSSDENLTKVIPKEEIKIVEKISDEEKFMQKMASIDSIQELNIMNSLSFNNNEGSTIEATAYFDKNGAEVKILELFNDSKTGNQSTTTFYIANGKKFASRQILFDNTTKPTKFIERISFYDSTQKVQFTKERSAEYEELLNDVTFSPAKLFDCNIDRAMRALNEQGEFETTFQGFVTTKDLDYILVGANNEEGFVSSLAIILPDETINTLKSNERKYIGTPLEVEFQNKVNGNGASYQALMRIRMK